MTGLGRVMDIAVQRARTQWREALDRVDQIVDRFVDRLPVDQAEWMTLEDCEHSARHDYYALLRTKYGMPTPLGLAR